MLFGFIRSRKIPGPGAEAYAFATAFGNPQFPLFRGRGVQVLAPLAVLQPAQAYYPARLTTTSGLGGLVYSTLYNQPLYVPGNTVPTV